MKNRSTIMQGLYVGIGAFLANAVVLPLLSEKTFASGAREGAIGGAITVALFAIIAALKPENRSEARKTVDADSGGPV